MWGRLLLCAVLGGSAACSKNDDKAASDRAAAVKDDPRAIPVAVADSYTLPRADKAQDVRGRRYLVVGPSSLSAGILPGDDDPGLGTFPGEAVELEQLGARMTDLADRLRIATERGIEPAEVDLAAIRAEEEARKKAERAAAKRAEEERRAADQAAHQRALEQSRKAYEELARQAAASGDEAQAETIEQLLAELDTYDTVGGGVVGGVAGSGYAAGTDPYDSQGYDYYGYRRPSPAVPPAEMLRPHAVGSDRPVLAADAAMPLVRLEAIIARLCDHGAHLAVTTPAADHAVQHPVALGTLKAGTCNPADDAGTGYWYQDGRRIVIEVSGDRLRMLESEYGGDRPEVIDEQALPGIVGRARRDTYAYADTPTLWIIAGEDASVADLITVLDVAGAQGVNAVYLADQAAWTKHREVVAAGAAGYGNPGRNYGYGTMSGGSGYGGGGTIGGAGTVGGGLYGTDPDEADSDTGGGFGTFGSGSRDP